MKFSVTINVSCILSCLKSCLNRMYNLQLRVMKFQNETSINGNREICIVISFPFTKTVYIRSLPSFFCLNTFLFSPTPPITINVYLFAPSPPSKEESSLPVTQLYRYTELMGKPSFKHFIIQKYATRVIVHINLGQMHSHSGKL